MDKSLKSVTHGQCDARPTTTFPAAGHHRPLTGTKLYCLATEAHVHEQLALGCYLKVKRSGVEPVTFCIASQHPNHHTTRPWLGMEKKLNLTQQNHALTKQKNVLQHKINTKKTKVRFSRLVRHPAWKRSGSILKGKNK